MTRAFTAVPSADRLVLRLLGGFGAERHGHALHGFTYDKPRALLAYLAVESIPVLHSREKLADLFWPDANGESARGNLRRALHELRKTLDPAGTGTEFFVSSKNHLGFCRDSPYWLDVAIFDQALPSENTPLPTEPMDIEALEQQLALYQGTFLQGISLPHAPELVAWVEAQRTRLRQHARLLLGRLAYGLEQQGQVERAQSLLQREIALEPWAEDAHRRLMQLLARQHQTSAALDQFEICRSTLKRDLNVEPEPKTLELAHSIRRGELMRATTAPHHAPEVQRRQVCVLVCELRAGPGQSDELAAGLLADCHGTCMEALAAHGGHGIAPQAGLILAYFGYPKAQEQAPVKALEAALDLIRRVDQNATLRIRVGAHCGWMVTDTRVHLPDATGLLTKHAQTLTQATSWGDVAVSSQVAHQVDGYFRLSSLQSEGNQSYHLLQARSAAHNRLQAATLRLTPFVGRVGELRLLRSLWEQTRQGHGQALIICAEAGMGKSRLIQMQEAQVAADGGYTCMVRCQSEFQHTPYYPWVEFLQQQLLPPASSGSDASFSRQQSLQQWLLSLDESLVCHQATLCDLLQLPQQDAPPLLSPSDRKQAIGLALRDVVHALAQRQGLMLVIEDVHWADAATQEWVQNYLLQLPSPFLLLLSSRTPTPLWEALRVLPLLPLSARQAEQLIRHTTSSAALDEPLRKRIQQRCDGVPLYIEEMARTLQAGLQGEIPDTISNLLAVRLESVGTAARLAQQAATVGRDFALDLLHALWDDSAPELSAHLERLEKAGLIQPIDANHYRFRHVLIQDAAYQTLALAERQRIHGRLVCLYQGPFHQQVANAPERLAQHLALAGEPQSAASTWLEAGRQAARRSANQEAIYHFEAGLAQLRVLDSADTVALELTLQAALGTTLVAIKGYGAVAAKVCFSRALELSRRSGDNAELFPVMWGLWLGGRSCTPEAYPLELAEKLAQIAHASGDAEQAMQMHYAYGNNLFWLARYAEAQAHLNQAVALGRQLPAPERIRLYGEDTSISSQSFLAWIHWVEGRPVTAVATAQEAVATARKLGHAHTTGFALTFAAVLHRFMGQPNKAEATAQTLLAHAQQHDLLLWQIAAGAVSGWSAVRLGHPEGLQQIERCVDASRQAMLAVESTFLSFQVDALWHLRDYAACAELARTAVERCEAYPDIYFVPEFLRLQALALFQLGDVEVALACLQRALDVATQQGAKALELRVTQALYEQCSEAETRNALRERMADILLACPELATSAEGVIARAATQIAAKNGRQERPAV